MSLQFGSQSAFFVFIKRIDQTLNFDWNAAKQITVTTILMLQVTGKPKYFKIGSRDPLKDKNNNNLTVDSCKYKFLKNVYKYKFLKKF